MGWRSVSVIAIAFDCFPELKCKCYCNISDTEFGRIKVEFLWKSPLEGLAFVVSEGAVQTAEEKSNRQSCPNVKAQNNHHSGEISTRAHAL